MFKKNPSNMEKDKAAHKVVTETVSKSGGVQTKTTTITCAKKDFDTAFKKLNLDPKKFQGGGTTVTRQIIYTNSSGDKEVLEETVETFEEPTENLRTTFFEEPTGHLTSARPENSKDSKDSKSFAQRLRLGGNKTATESSKVAKDVGKEAATAVKAGKFEEDCLRSHNEYRRKHGVPSLELSDEICAYSKEWADHLAATDTFEHRSANKCGENIFMKWSSDPNHAVAGNEAVDSWYSEIKDYTFGQEPRTLKSGHFTQVVWKDSNKLGVAWARSSSGKVLVVANYDPPGNFVGRFVQNVPPPKK